MVEFTVEKQALEAALKVVGKAVSGRPTMPVLKMVLMDAVEGVLRLRATDLDLDVTAKVEARVRKPGKVCLPVKKMAAVVAKLGDDSLEFKKASESEIEMVAGSARFTLKTIDPDEFPPFANVESDSEISENQGELRDRIRAVAYAQSRDEGRYVLCGVKLETAGSCIRLVATDGRRLAVSGRNFPIEVNADRGIVLMTKMIDVIEGLCDEEESLSMCWDDRRTVVKLTVGEKLENAGLLGSVVIGGRLIEARYPDWKEAHPGALDHVVEVARKAFQEILEREALMCDPDHQKVCLSFAENRLTVSAGGAYFGKVEDFLPIEWEGGELRIAFNPAFLIDVLAGSEAETVKLRLQGELSPMVIRTDECSECVVMPLRLA